MAMSRAQLEKSRDLWKSRESSRYKKWHFYRYQSKRPAAELKVLRTKWWTLYQEARTNRLKRDKQLSELRVTSVSLSGVKLIEQFEGFVGHPYQDAVGVWTIGYGHTEGVGPNSKHLTQAQATALLQQDLNKKYAPPVAALKLPLTQHQFDALVSFVYNVGPGGISSGTGVGRALRAHEWQAAADHLRDWNKAGGRVLPGLTARREAERALFLS